MMSALMLPKMTYFKFMAIANSLQGLDTFRANPRKFPFGAGFEVVIPTTLTFDSLSLLHPRGKRLVAARRLYLGYDENSRQLRLLVVEELGFVFGNGQMDFCL